MKVKYTNKVKLYLADKVLEPKGIYEVTVAEFNAFKKWFELVESEEVPAPQATTKPKPAAKG